MSDWSSGPTLAGFQTFVATTMGVPTSALSPTTSNAIYMQYALTVALAIVNQQLNQANPLIYTLAVYNLAGDNLINFCPDVTGQTYFTTLRGPGPGGYNITSFVAGVVAGSADESTSQTLDVPEFMKTITMGNLQNLKTPYGRQYLAFAQSAGTLWGLT